MNPLFKAWGEFVVRFRFPILAALAVGTVLFGLQIKRHAHVDNSVEAFAASNDGSQDVLERLRDEFGRDDVFVVLVKGDVFTDPYMTKLQGLHGEVAALNLELETLGQRKRDRDVLRGRDVAEKQTPEATPKEAPAADDEFGDFDDEFGADEDFGEEADEGWGEEAGGSIIDDVTSLINVNQVRSVDDGIQVSDLLDPMPRGAAALAAKRDEVLKDPNLAGRIVSRDGTLSAVVIRTHFMAEEDSIKVHDAIGEILEKYDGEGFETHIAGMPALAASLNRLMLGDMQGLFKYGVAVLLIIMFAMFRHPIGVISPLMVVALSAVWAFGLMASLNISITIMSNILPAFFICVGVADSVHLQSVYRSMRAQGVPNREAVINAVAETGVPIMFTSLTTATGLLSFKFGASVDAIGEMGLIGAFGVVLAFFNTVTVLPIMLSFNKTSLLGLKEGCAKDVIDTMIGFLVGLSDTVRRRRRTLIGTVLVTAVAVFGITQLRVWHNPLSWVPEDKPIKVAFNLADSELGGGAQINLMITADTERGVKDVDLLKGLEKLDAYLYHYEDPRTGEKIVHTTMSVLDVVRQTNQALRGGAEEHYRVPDTQADVNATFVAFENSAPEDLKRLMTIDATKAQMTITMTWLEATSYRPLATYVEEGVDKFIGADSGAKIEKTGAAYTLLTTVGALLMDLLRSFGLAFAVITVIMIFLLRDVKLGLVAMVPNLLPIAYIMGIMGFAAIPIDMANMLIASIALGLAVDDTIHFLHHFRVHYDRTGDVEGAIAHSVRHSGRALVITSIILSGGFFVYLAATMYSLQRFGSLIGLTVIIAVVLDLIVAPALLRAVYRTKTTQGGRQDGTPLVHKTAAQ